MFIVHYLVAIALVCVDFNTLRITHVVLKAYTVTIDKFKNLKTVEKTTTHNYEQFNILTRQ